MGKNSAALLKAICKYDTKTYKIVSFRLKRGDEDILNEAVQHSGLSKNAYIKQALNKQLAEDGYEPLK